MKFPSRSPLLAFCLLFFTGVHGLQADVTPSSMFGDHMVLQRGMAVPVWGVADPGERVSVAFARQNKVTEAGADGKWMVKMDALKASSKGRDLVISGNNTLRFEDVLVGEVWICSGQSNMQFGRNSVPELKKLVADAEKRPLRTYNVTTMVSLTPEENCAGGWTTAPSGSAVAFGFGYYLQKALQVPVAVIVTCWGSSSIEGWMPLDMTAQLPHFKKDMENFEKKDKKKVVGLIRQAKESGKGPKAWPRKENIYLRTRPNILYNAMLHPVIPYGCKGMVWYQGEANGGTMQGMRQYEESLQSWVKRLRKARGGEKFSFLAVMLPGFGKVAGGVNREVDYPDNASWAWMRESQMGVLELPDTGVANTIDLGDRKNIHPRDKEPICRRLSLLARGDVYGEKIPSRGPGMSSVEKRGGTMVVRFAHADGLKTNDGAAPKGFWIAGKKGAWHRASATIEGETVVLRSEKVNKPVACRYAFAAMPEVNLVNGAGLPAYPFRSDDWSMSK